MARSLGEAILRIRTDHAKALGGIRDLKGGVQNLGASFQMAGLKIAAFGAATTAVFAGIAAQSLSTFAGIEQTLQDAFSIAGFKKGENAAIAVTAAVEELGKSTKFTQLQIADGVRQLVSSGLNDPTALDGMLRTAAELATSISSDLPTAVGLAVSAVNAFPPLPGLDRLDPKNIDAAVNSLADLQGAARVEFKDLQQMFIKISDVFAITRGGEEEVRDIMAAFGALNQTMGNSRQAMTGISEAFRFLERGLGGGSEGAKMAKVALDKVGLTLADLDPRKVGLIQAVDNLALSGIPNMSKAALFFGASGMRAIRVLTKFKDRIGEVRTRMDNMADMTERERANLDTLQGSTLKLVAAWENMQKQLGKAISDAGWRTFVDNLRDGVNVLADWIRDNAKLAAGIIALGTAIGVASTALGISLMVIGALLSMLATVTMAIVSVITFITSGGLVAALALIGPLLVPIGIIALKVIGVLILLAAAFAAITVAIGMVVRGLIEHKEKVKALLGESKALILWSAIWRGLINVMKAVGSAFGQVADFISRKVGDLLDSSPIKAFFKTTGGLVGGLIPKVKNFFAQAVAQVRALVPMILKAVEPVYNAIIKIIGSLADILRTNFEIIGNAMSLLGGDGEGLLGFLSGAILLLIHLSATLMTATLHLVNFVIKILGFFYNAVIFLVITPIAAVIGALTGLGGAWIGFGDTFESVGDFIAATIELLAGTWDMLVWAFKNGVQLIANLISGFLTVVWAVFVAGFEIGSGIVIALINLMGVTWNLLVGWFKTGVQAIDGAIAFLVEVWEGFVSVIQAGVTQIGNALEILVSYWVAAKAVINFVIDSVVDAFNYLVDGWNSAVDSVTAGVMYVILLFIQMWNKVKGVLSFLSETFFSLGTNLMVMLWKGLKSMWEENIWPWLKSILSLNFKGAADIQARMVESIIDTTGGEDRLWTPDTVQHDIGAFPPGGIHGQQNRNDNRRVNIQVNNNTDADEVARVLRSELDTAELSAGAI